MSREERIAAKAAELEAQFPQEMLPLKQREVFALAEEWLRLERQDRLRPHTRGTPPTPYSLEDMAAYNEQYVKAMEHQQQLLSDLASGGEKALEAKVKIWEQAVDAMETWVTQYAGLEKTKITQYRTGLKDYAEGARGALELQRKIEDGAPTVDGDKLRLDYRNDLQDDFARMMVKQADPQQQKQAPVRVDVATAYNPEELRKFKDYIEARPGTKQSISDFIPGDFADALVAAEKNDGIISKYTPQEQVVINGGDLSGIAPRNLKAMIQEFAELENPDLDEMGRARYAAGLSAIISPDNFSGLYWDATPGAEGAMELIRNTGIPNLQQNLVRLSHAMAGGDPDKVKSVYESLTEDATVPEHLLPEWRKTHAQFDAFGSSLLSQADQPNFSTHIGSVQQKLEGSPEFRAIQSSLPHEKQSTKGTVQEMMDMADADARGRRKAERMHRKLQRAQGQKPPGRKEQRAERLRRMTEISSQFPSAMLNQAIDPNDEVHGEDTPPPVDESNQ